MSRGHSWERTVGLKLGIGGAVDFTPARVGQTLHLPCKHGHTVDFFVKARMPPEAVCKKLMQDGWTLGHKLTCPEHARKLKLVNPAPAPEPEPELFDQVAPEPKVPRKWEQRTPKPKKVAEARPIWRRVLEALEQFERPLSTADLADLTMSKPNSVLWAMRKLLADKTVTALGPHYNRTYKLTSKLTAEPKEEPMPAAEVTPIVPPPPTPAQATEAARTAKRLTVMALEESFNDGRYKPGVSDETIAKETGLSVAKVAEYREEFFGPIVEPTEIAAARAEIATLENRIEQFEKNAAEEVGRWRDAVAAHRNRLGALISKNGWKQP